MCSQLDGFSLSCWCCTSPSLKHRSSLSWWTGSTVAILNVSRSLSRVNSKPPQHINTPLINSRGQGWLSVTALKHWWRSLPYSWSEKMEVSVRPFGLICSKKRWMSSSACTLFEEIKRSAAYRDRKLITNACFMYLLQENSLRTYVL